MKVEFFLYDWKKIQASKELWYVCWSSKNTIVICTKGLAD